MELNRLRCILELVNVDGTGELTRHEFVHALKNERVRHALALLGIDVKVPELYFKTMASLSGREDDGKCGIDEFVAKLLKMRGGATSVDLQTLILETEYL